jgi:ribosome-associated protein
MTRRKNDPTSPDQAREFAIELARLAADDRCTDVKVLDLRNLSPVTDYFVIATGTSERQMATVGDHAKKLAKERSYSYIGSAGMDDPSWILIDLADIVVHVFNEQTRGYYDLDMLWGDAPRVDWQRGG